MLGGHAQVDVSAFVSTFFACHLTQPTSFKIIREHSTEDSVAPLH